MTQYSLVIFIVLLLAGCSTSSTTKTTQVTQSTRNQDQSSDSLALQVMNADGNTVGLKDTEVPLSYESGSADLMKTLSAAQLGGHLLGSSTPIPGISSAGMTTFFVLDLIASSDETSLTRLGLWMPVWMPANLASNPQQAQLEMSQIVEKAVTDALSPEYKVEPYEWVNRAIFGAKNSYRALRVDGPLCEQWSCLVEGVFSNHSLPEESFKARIVKTDTPDFIDHGHESSYKYRRNGYITIKKIADEYDKKGLLFGQWHRFEFEGIPGFDHTSFYKRVSANLPDWAYTYVGPESFANEYDVPYVLHRGEQLFFVKPHEEVIK